MRQVLNGLLYIAHELGLANVAQRIPAEDYGLLLLQDVSPRGGTGETIHDWYRRLSKDYEELTENSEAMILLCMIHRMLRRLKPVELAAGWEM